MKPGVASKNLPVILAVVVVILVVLSLGKYRAPGPTPLESDSAPETEYAEDAQTVNNDTATLEPRPDAEGACCLDDGSCLELTFRECEEKGGRFVVGYRCYATQCDYGTDEDGG
ncbi:MAG: hypothetical protein PVI86_17600 [Phycisphaerae bacterium]|jgi:hypothetical protein